MPIFLPFGGGRHSHLSNPDNNLVEGEGGEVCYSYMGETQMFALRAGGGGAGLHAVQRFVTLKYQPFSYMRDRQTDNQRRFEFIGKEVIQILNL